MGFLKKIDALEFLLGALESVLMHETDLGWEDPVIHLVLLAIIGTAHWKRRWRPGGPPASESPVARD